MKDLQSLQPSDELKTLLREGVPSQLRCQVWKAYVYIFSVESLKSTDKKLVKIITVYTVTLA